MTEQQRWRWWTRSTVGAALLVTGGMAVAAATRSTTVLVIATGFLVLAMLCAVAVTRRPGTLVPPPLQGLETGQRRLVTEAVNAGERAPDLALAGAVAAMARRRSTAMVALLLSAAIGLYLRIDSLASAGGSLAFDLAVVTFWVAIALVASRTLVRARRAANA